MGDCCCCCGLEDEGGASAAGAFFDQAEVRRERALSVRGIGEIYM